MSGFARLVALIAGLGAGVVLIILAVFAPRVAAAGWLIGFATVAAVMLGAAALVLIHALTGGRWGDFARPALQPMARALPLLLLAFLLVAIAAPAIYPWATDPSRAGPGVAAIYLNIPFFTVRGAVVIAGLALLMWLARGAGLGRLAAGVGLVWYCVGLDAVSVDWLQSVEPRYTSSAFGTQIIIDQLVAALAWAILALPADTPGGRWSDLGSLLLATTLGESYLILMTLVVHWYGDLPDQAEWYLHRTDHGWVCLEITGTVIGAVGPLVALLFAPVRQSGRALKIVAAAALAGVLLENIWLVAPSTSAWALLIGPLATVALGGIALGLAGRLRDGSLRTRRLADGV